MSQVFVDTPAERITGEPPRKRWSRDEVELLEQTGLFEGAHYELIEGELINKMGKNWPHISSLVVVVKLLREIFGYDWVVTEPSIDVSPEDNPTSLPEPDAIVLIKPHFEYRSQRPRPRDLLLVVEVADTTLAFDLRVKALLYARAGIPDYWIVDLAGRRILVHRDPAEGVYQSVTAYTEADTIEPLARPGAAFAVAAVFPA
jgi:Uma2 family endonuclease